MEFLPFPMNDSQQLLLLSHRRRILPLTELHEAKKHVLVHLANLVC